MTKTFLAIFIGGGLGSVMRYGVQLLLHERITAYHFPWATFCINITGSFLIGLFYGLSAKFNLPGDVRLLLTAGLCGGFTTFSTFSNDIVEMTRQGDWTGTLTYIILSIVIGALACMAGSFISK